jgi:hypothetical protein
MNRGDFSATPRPRLLVGERAHSALHPSETLKLQFLTLNQYFDLPNFGRDVFAAPTLSSSA